MLEEGTPVSERSLWCCSKFEPISGYFCDEGGNRRDRDVMAAPADGAPARPQTPIPAGGTRPAGVASSLGTEFTPGNGSPDWFHPGTSCPEQTLPSLGRGRAACRVWPGLRGRGQEEPGLGERKEEGRGAWRRLRPRAQAQRGVGPSVLLLLVPTWMPRVGVRGLTGRKRLAAHMATFYSACLQMEA